MVSVLGRWSGWVLGAIATIAVAAGGDSPEDFARKIAKTKGASAVVNLREDKSLGAIAVALDPALVAERERLEPVLAEIGQFAAARQFGATVVTPKAADAVFVVGKLKAAGIERVKTQPMAASVSIKTSRIFIVPAN